ncbi:MAG: thioredoxin domain-containing protein [Chloroflexota bacterium]
MLQTGSQAPDFELPSVNHGTVSRRDLVGKRIAWLFLPSNVHEELGAQLTRYQENIATFEELNAAIVAISDASLEELQSLATSRQIKFALLSDPQKSVWKDFAAPDCNQPIQPTVFVTDEQNVIRAVYEAARNPNLPGPLALARAIRKLNDVPKPAPVTEQDWRIGPLNAPVTLIEYSDFQCQHCRELSHVIEQLIAAYGDKIQVVHRHLPLRQTHPLAQLAAEAAEVAGLQGKYWEMHHRLFAANDALEREHLIAYARELGLNVEQFIGDLNSHRGEASVNEDWTRAVQSGIKLPPTLFINSILFEGARTEAALRARIDGLLA